ncbi:MAG: hypothetical protein HRT61_20380 [Ekhidna sp.]|nr:hypothetical protein [Ekhidna sp.]
MTHSKPKIASLFAVILFLLIVLSVEFWLILGIYKNPESYFYAKAILVPILFVIAILVGVKSYFSSISISLGNNKITYKFPLGSKHEYGIKEIATWDEEVVKRGTSEFRQLSIQLKNDKKLRISNHENTNYGDIRSYLKKKVKK